MEVLENLCVYGLWDSIKASKYPMSTDIRSLTDDVTDRVISLATSPKGQGHDQFLTGIIAQFDLTFSIKAWVEAERYHFLDFVSSQSTMHRITRMNVDEQCNEYVDAGIKLLLQRKIEQYNENKTPQNYLRVLYNIPTGYTLTARMTTNYRQLKTIYSQRKNHRLPEWREFCKKLESFPRAEFITMERGSDGEITTI